MDSKDRPYHHGDLKTALVQAGIELLEEEGLKTLSLRGIAARAGVSHTAPKNHFGSLRGLLTAIATEAWHRHTEAMQGSLAADARPAQRLAAMSEGYVRFARENPELYQLMLSPLHCDMGDEAYREAGIRSYSVLAEVARGIAEAEHLGTDEARRIEVMLWSLAHGYVTLAQSGLLSDQAGRGPRLSILDILPRFPGLDDGPGNG